MAYVVGGTRQKLSTISTVTNQDKTSRMIVDSNFNWSMPRDGIFLLDQ